MLIEDYIISKEVDSEQEYFNFPYLVTEEVEKKSESEYAKILMKLDTMLIKLEKSFVRSYITYEQRLGLKKEFNIDVEKMVTSALEQEFENTMETQIVSKIYEVATNTIVNKTGMKWWNQIFGYWNPPYRADDKQSINISMLKASNMIAKNNRRGTGDFAIVSARIGKVLEYSQSMTLCETPLNTEGGYGQLYKIGVFYGMDILIDPRISYTDKPVIVVGRNTKNDEGGVVNLFTKPLIQTEETAQLYGFPSIDIRKTWDGQVFNTPNAKDNYYKINLTYEKYPFWNHIKTKIKNLF